MPLLESEKERMAQIINEKLGKATPVTDLPSEILYQDWETVYIEAEDGTVYRIGPSKTMRIR